MKKQIFLVGFRAVGKTTVGKELARLLGFQFVDTDELIVNRYGCSIADIVKESGWEAFRASENEVLLDLKGGSEQVIATGGGAILHQKTWEKIIPTACIIWLSATIATHAHRLSQDAASCENRPSLTGEHILAEISPILTERTPLYRKVAQLEIATDKKSVQEIVQEIAAFYADQPDAAG